MLNIYIMYMIYDMRSWYLHASLHFYICVCVYLHVFLCPLSELNSCDEQGSVPLHWAVERNKPESCRALLDLGADPNILNMALLSPLHLAINLGHNNLVEVMMLKMPS